MGWVNSQDLVLHAMYRLDTATRDLDTRGKIRAQGLC